MANVQIQTKFLLELSADEMAMVQAALEGRLPPPDDAAAKSLANEILRQRIAAHVTDLNTLLLSGTVCPQLQTGEPKPPQVETDNAMDVVMFVPEQVENPPPVGGAGFQTILFQMGPV